MQKFLSILNLCYAKVYSFFAMVVIFIWDLIILVISLLLKAFLFIMTKTKGLFNTLYVKYQDFASKKPSLAYIVRIASFAILTLLLVYIFQVLTRS